MSSIYSTAVLGGGIGAQLFQVSHACAQGWKHNVEPVFCTKLYETYNYPQDFWPQNYLNNIYRNLKFVEDITDYITLEENEFNTNRFINTNIDFNKTIIFRGLYESHKNFLGYDEKLVETFSPTEEFIDRIGKRYPQITNNRTVSMHMRRGDFFNVSHILPVVDISYFKECINMIGEYDTLFVFSNDKEYANSLNFNNMIVVSGLETYEELWLMSMCKTNILSNSTYGYWAEFLNTNKNKVVYSPDIWFGPAGPPAYDSVFRDHWNLVSTELNGSFIIKK